MRWTKGRGFEGAESLLLDGRVYVSNDGRWEMGDGSTDRTDVLQFSLSLSRARS